MFDQRMPLNVNDMLHPLRGATEKTAQVTRRLSDFPQADPDIITITAEVNAATEVLNRAIALIEVKQQQEDILHAKQSTLHRLASFNKPIVSVMMTSGDAQKAAVADLVTDGLITQTPVGEKFEYAITDAGRQADAEFDVVRRAAHEAQKAFRRVDVE